MLVPEGVVGGSDACLFLGPGLSFRYLPLLLSTFVFDIGLFIEPGADHFGGAG